MLEGLKDRLKDAIGGARDGALEMLINIYADYWKGIGKVVELKVDSGNAKTIYLKVKLEGESEPIELKAKGYSIFKKDDKHYIKIESFEVSRKWMDIILNSYVKDEAFEIDGKLAKVLGSVI